MNNYYNSRSFLLGSTLRQIGKLARKRFQANELNISPEQFGILNMIQEKDEFIQADLAAILDKDKSAVLRHIDHLESNNLIVRVNDPADRRRKFLNLTKEGEVVLDKAREIVISLINDLEKGVPEAELEIYTKVLKQMRMNGENLSE